MTGSPVAGDADRTSRRLLSYLEGEGLKITPLQAEGIRLRIIESETQDTLRLLTQILETLRTLNTSDRDQAEKLDTIADEIRDIKLPLQTLAEEGKLRIEVARADISNRQTWIKSVGVPVLAALGGSLATVLTMAANYYFGAGP